MAWFIGFYNGFRCFSAVGNPTVDLPCPDLARYFLLKITMFSLKCYKSLAISEGITFVFCIVFSKCLPCFGLPWRTLVSVILWIPLQTSFKIIITPKSASILVNLEPYHSAADVLQNKILNLPWSSIRPASPLTLKISSKLWPAISLPEFCIFIMEIVHFWLNRLGGVLWEGVPPWPQSFIKCVFSVGFHMELHLACNACLMLELGSGTHFILFFSASRCLNRHVARKTNTVSFAASISFYEHFGCFVWFRGWSGAPN